MEYVELRNGMLIPMLGYGTLNISPESSEEMVLTAIKNGYRFIDTAASYLNEVGIGKAVKKSGIPRDELIICTKVWIQDAGYENTRKAFYTSLSKLGIDYMDIYLIHQPYGDYYGSWRAMEDLYREGKVKSIGVSNFSQDRFVDLCLNSTIAPMINQIEIHPFFQQNSLLKVMKKYGCIGVAWAPLVESQKNIFEQKLLVQLATKYHKTVSQIILRWHFQRGIVTIPKTKHSSRMKENMGIWDFVLDDLDMKVISDLDLGYSEIINHQSYKTTEWLNKYKIHE